MELTSGDILTVKHEIISSAGRIIFNPEDKVQIDEVIIEEAHYGKMTGTYYPEKITDIKLVGYYGYWNLDTFEETQSNPIIIRKVLIEKIVYKKILHG